MSNSAGGDSAKLVGFTVVLLPLSLLAVSRSVRMSRSRGALIEY